MISLNGNGKAGEGGGISKKREYKKNRMCQQLGFNLKLCKMVGELVKEINDCLFIIRVLAHIKESRIFY